MENDCVVKPKPKTIKEFCTSMYFWRPFIAVIVGGIAGFLYYRFVGCSSGHCAITSNPYMSVLWGSLMGFFLVSSPCSRGKC